MFTNPLKRAVNFSLATKLILVVVLLLSSVSLLLTFFFISRQKTLLSHEQYTRIQSLANNLAYNSKNYMLASDYLTIQSFVDGVHQEPDIEHVFLTDSEGTVLASSDTSQTKKTIPVPFEYDTSSEKLRNWADTRTTRRMIIPINVDIPIVDTNSMIYSSTDQNDAIKNSNYFFLQGMQPGFNHTSDEVTFTSSFFYGIRKFNMMSISIEKRTAHLLIELTSNGFWSHDGRYFAFNSFKDPPELSVLDTQSKEIKIIATKGTDTHGVPCFTPDDRYVIVTLQTKDGAKRLFRIPRDGGNPEQLTFHEGDHWFPNCSPDGRWILYTEFRDFRLYVYNTVTKKSYRLFPNMAAQHFSGSFSPDGTHFCYITQVDAASDIWDVFIAEFPLNGKPLTDLASYGKRITFTGTYKWYTDWSPDGKLIAYAQWHRDAGDLCHIWIVPAQGGKPTNLTASLKTQKKKIGYAVFDISLENLNRMIAHSNRIAFLIAFVFTGIGAVSALLLVRSIVHPVRELALAASEVGAGDLDIKVAVDRHDEIGILSNSFNRMTEQLKISKLEIESRTNALEKAYSELKTLDTAKDTFLSLVSHEIRTPLSTISLNTEMLLHGLVQPEEKRRKFLNTILDNCERLTRLINNVLDISKIEAGRMSFSMKPLDITELIDDTIVNFETRLAEKKIHLNHTKLTDTVYVRGDRDRIIQVLTNIISNSLKNTPPGGSIAISVTRGDDMATVAIKDTGRGIRKEDIPKVFDRFSQIGTINHHSEGTGLGMSISKSIIERHGGSIRIESEPGAGTTVFFTLPLENTHPAVMPESLIGHPPMDSRIRGNDIPVLSESIIGHTPVDSRLHGNDGSVMPESLIGHPQNEYMDIFIVDDEAPFRAALKECLEQAGYRTVEAANGKEALEEIEKHQPSLVILDIMMPDMSGLEICRILKKDTRFRGMKIIFLSARGQEKEKEEGLAAGADRYITKPFNYRELIKAIEELLS